LITGNEGMVGRGEIYKKEKREKEETSYTTAKSTR